MAKKLEGAGLRGQVAGETSLFKLTTAYASFVNGGKKVQGTLIDRIQDRRGKNIFVNDQVVCSNCDMPYIDCLLYTSPSPRYKRQSRMPSSA